MEDMMVKANDSLVTKQLAEEVADSGEIAAILNSENIDTRTGLLNALVFWFIRIILEMILSSIWS